MFLVGQPIWRAAGAASATWTASAQDLTIKSSYSFASLAIGAAASNRYVAVLIHNFSSGSNTTVSSVTVGGAATTRLVQQNTAGTNKRQEICITSAVLPSCATASDPVNLSTHADACAGDSVAIAGLASITPQDSEAVATDVQNYSNTGITAPRNSGTIAGRYTIGAS